MSIRKLADHLRRNTARPIRVGREALRCQLVRRGVTFQRTKTSKESTDPDSDTKLDRIEYALNERPDRTFAFDGFGPLGIRPTAGSCWAGKARPNRLPATFHRTHGTRYFHGCYSVGDDTLWGVTRCRKGTANTLTALKSIRDTRPDGAPIGAHFGPLRQFALANSHQPDHTIQARALHAYLRWCDADARHPYVLAAQRKERARVRSEKGIRWGGRPLAPAA